MEHGTTATETQRGDSMDFFETMKSGAFCGNSGGGDTPSPSGNPHFSKIIISTYEGKTAIVLNSGTGEYAITQDIIDKSPVEIFLFTPAKKILGLTDLYVFGGTYIYFTPAEDFSTDDEVRGEITNGDGKVYELIVGSDSIKVSDNSFDFFASLS
jgi:hypothetical protein